MLYRYYPSVDLKSYKRRHMALTRTKIRRLNKGALRYIVTTQRSIRGFSFVLVLPFLHSIPSCLSCFSSLNTNISVFLYVFLYFSWHAWKKCQHNLPRIYIKFFLIFFIFIHVNISLYIFLKKFSYFIYFYSTARNIDSSAIKIILNIK